MLQVYLCEPRRRITGYKIGSAALLRALTAFYFLAANYPPPSNRMQTIFQSVQVTFRYAVCFTNGLFAPENPLLEEVIRTQSDNLPTKVLFIVDGGVALHHPGLSGEIESYCRYRTQVLTLVQAPLVMEGGECAKNDPANVEVVYEAIHRLGLDRHSYIVVVGGGALIDMVGYAAATAHRGVRLIRVPTTVLAQNDSGVGVKNGINAYNKKNFLGTFAPPAAVLNDFDFLCTLCERDWRSGMAEAVKVALIKDAKFFEFIEEHAGVLSRRDMPAMEHLIYRCAQLHLEHIAGSGDPFEFGSSRPLDFGHWAAHKLEPLTGYTLRHGEAVAVGIALDTTYAYLSGLLAKSDWQRVLNVLLALGLAVYTPELSLYRDRTDERCILQGLSEFREHLGGKLTIMLLARIGRGVEVHEMDEDKIIESIELLAHYQTRPAREPGPEQTPALVY